MLCKDETQSSNFSTKMLLPFFSLPPKEEVGKR